MTLDNIKEEIFESKNIVILTHEVPDGDAVGSSLAMYMGLKQLGKEVDVIIPKYSKTFEFLPCANEIKAEGKNENYDLAIALDCGDIKRLNGFANYFEDANTKIQIDHHEANTMFADYNFVNPTSPACCQILITVLKTLGVEITKDIGTCLLTGIITDTGGFQYQNVKPETFEFAAELLSTADSRAPTHPAAPAGLAEALVAVFEISNHAYDGAAFGVDEANFAAGHLYRCDSAFNGNQLRARSGASCNLGAFARLHLYRADSRGCGYELKGHAHAGVKFVGTLVERHDRVALLEAVESDYVALLAVLVFEQSQIRRAVGIVLYCHNLRGNVYDVALEVDYAVEPLVPAAAPARCYSAVAVAALGAMLALCQRTLRTLVVDFRAAQFHESLSGSQRSSFYNSHFRFSSTMLIRWCRRP